METAKHYPGKMNAPFVAGDNVLTTSTGIINSCTFSIDSAPIDQGTGYSDLGARDYTVILYCPVLSAFYGIGSLLLDKPAGL
jgi:hypothetical protein